MGFIVWLLIVILIIVNSNSKAKKRQAKGGAAKRPAEGPMPRGAIPKAAEEFDEALEQLQSRLAVAGAAKGRKARQGASMLEDAECAGGSMAHTHEEGHSHLEDEDCGGGSMAHTHTEGVSRADHARRMAAIDAAAANDDMLPQTIDARALRRAVVMAEVLGRPRALKKS